MLVLEEEEEVRCCLLALFSLSAIILIGDAVGTWTSEDTDRPRKTVRAASVQTCADPRNPVVVGVDVLDR